MKLLIICGKACSGKDTLATNLLLRNYFSTIRIVSYTTRPKRANEVNGIDYNFVTDKQFDQMLKADEFINVTKYDINSQHYRYAFSKNSFYNNFFTNIVIANPEGVFAIHEHFKYNRIQVIYLKENKHTLRKRWLKRGGTEQDFNSRILKDDIDFKNFVRKAKKLGIEITPMKYSVKKAEKILKKL